MAKCRYCMREMLIADGCGYTKVECNGKEYDRIKVGDEEDFFFGDDPEMRCTDCNAKMGYFHHAGCDCERCPVCGGQFISCDCDCNLTQLALW